MMRRIGPIILTLVVAAVLLLMVAPQLFGLGSE
jgi:hypothetical protein